MRTMLDHPFVFMSIVFVAWCAVLAGLVVLINYLLAPAMSTIWSNYLCILVDAWRDKC